MQRLMLEVWRRARWAPIPLCTLIFAACGSPDRVEITETRPKSEVNPPVAVEATSEERFGMARGGGMSPADGTPQNPFHWDTPEGWQELPSTQMRLVNFQVDGAEAYLSALPGRAGGAFANINRWREQMGLETITQEEMAELPTRDVIGQQAVYVVMRGTYTGMGAQPEPNSALIGAIFDVPQFTIFAKMVGPEDVVLEEEPNFNAFLDSLHFGGDHTHEPDTAQSATSARPDEMVAQVPEEPLPEDAPEDEAEPEGEEPAEPREPRRVVEQGFSWEVPDGWKRAGEKPMRLVTYLTGEDDAIECYVTVLGGTGGGVAMNLNRWRQQMGKPPLTEAMIEELDTIEMLGEDAFIVEITGTYTGMGAAPKPEHMMLGTVALLNNQSVFVKMIGPESQMRERLPEFKTFCESLTKE